MSATDVLVLGGGLNGLVAAARLAKRGRKVLLLERRDTCGGLAAGAEFHPGHRTVGLLHDASEFRPSLISELSLEKHGLRLGDPYDVFAPLPGGRGLVLAHDPKRAREEIAAFSARDADAYVEYRRFLDRVGGFVRRLLESEPPGGADPSLSDLAGTGWALRRLGRDAMMELLRIGPMCVADWLREWFETEAIGATLAQPALFPSFAGPWSPATNALLLRHEVLRGRSPRGGPAALAAAVESSARALGVEIRTGTHVSAVRVESGRVTGVETGAGETLDARTILATCDPRTLFLERVPRRDLPPALVRRLETYRMRGTTAKVHLALSEPPRWAARPGESFEVVRVGETFDDQERAFDPVKYGRLPDRPMLEVLVANEADPDAAPEGCATLSVMVHAVPLEVRGEGGADDARSRLRQVVLARLEEAAPGLSASVAAAEVLLPSDLAERTGIAGGHLYHGEMALEQWIARPGPECARYATPVAGLFLGGGGAWPGGGLTGLPGALAADRVLAERSAPN